MRDYQPGDSLRRIDWKATARRGHLQSRVYEPSATLHLLVALNLTTLEQTWSGYDPLLLELAITVAASLATQASQQGQSVGLLTNGSFPEADRPVRLLPGRHPHHSLPHSGGAGHFRTVRHLAVGADTGDRVPLPAPGDNP